MNYYPKLDGLRALAVTGVLVDHYLPGQTFQYTLPWGSLGVQCFFVLSGFLITSILIKSKVQSSNLRVTLKAFYARRFLRIFPPYYFLLFASLALGVSFSIGPFMASIFYVLNYLQALYPTHEYLYLGHLWSLCIEEQFYMFWPLAVLFLHPSRLFTVSIFLVLLAVVSRGAFVNLEWNYISIRNLPTSQLDALVGGAMLAQLQSGLWPTLLRAWRTHYIKITVMAAIVYLASRFAPLWTLQEPTIGILSSSVFFAGLIEYATTNQRTVKFRLLDSPILQYVGRISYGIYLYHFFSFLFFYKIMSIFNASEFLSIPSIRFVVLTAITLTIATLSWYCLEKPILKLKRNFQYTPKGSL